MVSVVDLQRELQTVSSSYANFLLTHVNDHAVRVSVMTEPYFWHQHPNSDETFIVLEGTLIVELEHQVLELTPGQACTIPRGTPHLTRPREARSVNLTVELKNIETVPVDRESQEWESHPSANDGCLE